MEASYNIEQEEKHITSMHRNIGEVMEFVRYITELGATIYETAESAELGCWIVRYSYPDEQLYTDTDDDEMSVLSLI
jgi:hypothetical protein